MTYRYSVLLITILMTACTAPKVHSPEVVPDIHGRWRIVAQTPTGEHEADMYVVQDGRAISGRFEGALGVMHYTGTVNEREIRFSHNAMQGPMPFDYHGTIEANVMTGTAVFGTLGTGTWTASRTASEH